MSRPDDCKLKVGCGGVWVTCTLHSSGRHKYLKHCGLYTEESLEQNGVLDCDKNFRPKPLRKNRIVAIRNNEQPDIIKGLMLTLLQPPIPGQLYTISKNIDDDSTAQNVLCDDLPTAGLLSQYSCALAVRCFHEAARIRYYYWIMCLAKLGSSSSRLGGCMEVVPEGVPLCNVQGPSFKSVSISDEDDDRRRRPLS